MLYLRNFKPQSDERMTDYVSAQEAIKSLKQNMSSGDSETILVACSGYSHTCMIDALRCLGYTTKELFLNEGAILLVNDDGEEALLGYRPMPTEDINISILMLEMSVA